MNAECGMRIEKATLYLIRIPKFALITAGQVLAACVSLFSVTSGQRCSLVFIFGNELFGVSASRMQSPLGLTVSVTS